MLTSLQNAGCVGLLGAFRAKAPGPGTVRRVLEAGSFPEAVRVLASVEMLRERGFSAEASDRECEHALWQARLTCADRFVRFSWGAVRRSVETVLLRYDVRNLKALFRTLVSGTPTREAVKRLLYRHKDCFLGAGAELPVDLDRLGELCHGGGLGELFDGARRAWDAEKDPFRFDLSLETAWLREAVEALEALDSDAVNAWLGCRSLVDVLWLRFFRGMSAEEVFHYAVRLPRFLGRPEHRALLEIEKPGDWTQVLGERPLSAFVLERDMEVDTVSRTQEACRRYVWSLLRRRRRDAYDAESVMEFLVRMEMCVQDIVTALQALRAGVRPEDAASLLVTVQESA